MLLKIVLVTSVLFIVIVNGCKTPTGEKMGKTAKKDPPDPPSSVEKGKQLFNSRGCTACHMVNGKGGTAGPDLSDEADKGHSRKWLMTQIRDPKANDPQTFMPAFDTLTDEQVNDLVDYLMTLKTKSSQSAEPRGTTAVKTEQITSSQETQTSAFSMGAQRWAETCGQCHNLRDPSEYSDAQWAVAVHHMRVRVPLTGEEQKLILKFLQESN